MLKLTINSQQLIDNIHSIKDMVGVDKDLIYVAKANCYGLSTRAIVPLVSQLTNKFAIATVSEGIEVKRYCDNAEIHLLTPTITDSDIAKAMLGDFIMQVSTLKEIEDIASVADRLHCSATVSIKVDIGMNRFGFSSKAEVLKAIKLCENLDVKVACCYTHLPTGDEEICHSQMNKFMNITKDLPLKTHITCNNTTMTKHYNVHGYRLGIKALLGGAFDSIKTAQCFDITTMVLAVKQVKQGETIGYNHGYTALHDMKIAIVSIGYADLHIRALKDKGVMLINDIPCKIIGYPCMDVSFLDVTNCPCNVGDKVTVTSNNPLVNINRIAQLQNTVPHEILTSIGNRVEILTT